uniref:Gnk2-homologous domain-containing protein n=1 Tax=Glycine max TaxID=3847 RepID=K7MD81_SOYBN
MLAKRSATWTHMAQTPIYAGSYCQNTTQPPLSSAYQTNLNRIVTWMSSDAATSKGYNYTSIGNNSPAYGLYDCHSDVVGYFCQLCVSTAAREVRLRCPNRISAVVWYDSCILRHTQHGITYFGTKNISNMEEIQKGEDFVRSLIRKATVETNQLYYMEGFNVSSSQRRYGWVQCSRDLSNEGCRQCLEAMLAEYPKCCEQKLGWMVWCQSCLIRYEDHIFYQLNQKVAPSVGTGSR